MQDLDVLLNDEPSKSLNALPALDEPTSPRTQRPERYLRRGRFGEVPGVSQRDRKGPRSTLADPHRQVVRKALRAALAERTKNLRRTDCR